MTPTPRRAHLLPLEDLAAAFAAAVKAQGVAQGWRERRAARVRVVAFGSELSRRGADPAREDLAAARRALFRERVR